jgi:hypothetical protein
LAKNLGKRIFSNFMKICRLFSSIMRKNLRMPPTRFSALPARVHACAANTAAGDAGHMFFLLRMAFWLGVVLILLPIGAPQRQQASNDVGASEAISAASATVEDLRGFCARQHDACTVGSQVATAIGYRAQAGAKILYDVLTEALGPHETGSLPRGTARRGADRNTALGRASIDPASQDTLTPADLAPAWRGPTGHKGAKHAA